MRARKHSEHEFDSSLAKTINHWDANSAWFSVRLFARFSLEILMREDAQGRIALRGKRHELQFFDIARHHRPCVSEHWIMCIAQAVEDTCFEEMRTKVRKISSVASVPRCTQ